MKNDMEYIDKVDAKDVVIGKTTKIESHRYGWYHRVVAVFVMRGDTLLINQRHDNGLFDHSVGGHVQAGESYDDAARREAREEIGFIAKQKFQFIERFLVPEKWGDEIMNHWFVLYLVHAPNDFMPRPQPREVIGLVFKDIKTVTDEMKKYPERFTMGFQGTMKVFLEKCFS